MSLGRACRRAWSGQSIRTGTHDANLQPELALCDMAWSNLTRTEIIGRMAFAMEAATAAARYLPFLEAAEESALLGAATPKSFDRNQLVLDQDVPMRTIFLIDDGSVRVEREDQGQMVPLAFLGAGEFFGEMSFIDGAPTSARVVAEEATRLRIIDEANVDRLTSIDPSFAGRLYRSIAAILVERLRRTSMQVSLENRQV